MIEAALYFSVMSVIVKYVGRTVPFEELVLARSVVALVLSYGMLRANGVDPWGVNRKLLVVRGLFGLIGLCCFYYALTKLPLGDVTVIQYTNPAFVAVLAAFLLGERAGFRASLFAAAAATVGVVLIARPSFLFGEVSETIDTTAAWIAFGGALASSAAYVTVRKLGETEHPVVVVFWFPLIATPILFPFAWMTGYIPTWSELGLLFLLGCATQAAQVRMTQGLKLESAARATGMTYLQIVFAFTWGVLLFDEVPTIYTILGALLVVTTVIALARTKSENAER